MPVKRRVSKRGKLVLTDRAKEIWRSGKGKELVVLIPSGDGMVVYKKSPSKYVRAGSGLIGPSLG